MKGELLLTVGVSTSGKSSWAASKVQKEPNKYCLVNRDAIRNLLFGYTDENVSEYYQREDLHKLEKQVTKYEDTLINEGLCAGKSVIVDATHLKRSYLERFKYWNVPTRLIEFEISLEEAKVRNSSRIRKIPEGVLGSQFTRCQNLFKSLENDPIDFTPVTLDNSFDSTKPNVFLFDLDGTLAHMDRDLRSPYEWSKVGLDTADPSIKILYNKLNIALSDADVLICTGREDTCRLITYQWLSNNGMRSADGLFMREEGDNRADWIVKEEMWREITKRYNIVGLIEDRLQIVRRARALGLKVFNVEYNNF